MKHTALVLSFFAFTVWTADQAHGQAMIGYGINVGRAGAAGAAAGATGAGMAGIFNNLNNRLSEEPNTQSGARSAQPEFDREELERSRNQRRAPSFSTSGTTIETSSGVRISGHPSSRPPVTPARYQARSFDYEPAPSVPAASPVSSVADPIAEQPEQSASTSQGEAQPATEAEEPTPLPTVEIQETPEQAAQPVSVMNARTGAAGQAGPANNTGGLDPALRRLLEIDSEIADIPEGTSIEDVIARFGKPIFKMAGLPGEGYSEKYIFRMADGRRFTVFTQGGMVANIIVEPLLLGNRAAL
ncbi:MAG: hypothetical protein O2968_12640 [Acidobacteria bacterium]|nr:hypothetical protein [Acidobacteriota bacterium]